MEYLLVDGYNIINAWPELKRIAQDNLEEARMRLVDILQDYQGYKGNHIIIVFDAHHTNAMVNNHEVYGNVEVVYTKKNETADHYIERWVNEMGKAETVRVATSDYLQQTIVLSRGGVRMSARELREEVMALTRERRKLYLEKPQPKGNTLGSRINPGVLEKLERWRRQR